jgi:hypothetical protein
MWIDAIVAAVVVVVVVCREKTNKVSSTPRKTSNATTPKK